MLPAMTDPDSPAYGHPAGETVRNATSTSGTERRGIFAANAALRALHEATPTPTVREHLDMNVVRSAWADIVGARRTATTSPACSLRSSPTSTPPPEPAAIYENLHRNVVFRGASAPDAPFSRLDSYNPEDLWARDGSVWRAEGLDAIAIPAQLQRLGWAHVRDAPPSRAKPIDAAYVEKRSPATRPIAELSQAKGTSETHPGTLSQ